MSHFTAGRGSWAARLCRAGQTRNRRIGEPLLSYLTVIDLGHKMRELSAGEWLAGCNISFDRVSLIATGGFSTRLGRIGGSTLPSNEEIEASERVRAMGKLAIYTPKAVVEHVISPERLTPNRFRRRASWQVVSDFSETPGTYWRRRSSASTPTRFSRPLDTTRPRSPRRAESAWFELPLSTAEKTVSASENRPLGAE
jgi:hypothetical protein